MPPAANAIGAEPLIEPPASLVALAPVHDWEEHVGSAQVIQTSTCSAGIIDLDAQVPVHTGGYRRPANRYSLGCLCAEFR